jgi:Rap1a immunity proteins
MAWDSCRRPSALCSGYLAGVGAFQNLPDVGRRYCNPDGPTFAQLRAIVVKYLKDNPSKLHRPFIELVLEALHNAFPCPRR